MPLQASHFDFYFSTDTLLQVRSKWAGYRFIFLQPQLKSFFCLGACVYCVVCPLPLHSTLSALGPDAKRNLIRIKQPTLATTRPSRKAFMKPTIVQFAVDDSLDCSASHGGD